MTTVFAGKAFLEDGWAANVRLQTKAGEIVSIDDDTEAASGDVMAGFVIPGLTNAHSHAFQRALAGHTEARSPEGKDNFWSWRERMYALAAKVDADALRAIARQAYSEMLASGYTSVAEFHYLHRDPRHSGDEDAMFGAIVGAAEDAGIRLCYVPVHYERASFEESAPAPHQQSFAQPLDEFVAHHERAQRLATDTITAGIGVHSLRAVCAESLQAIANIASEQFIPLHLHIAEQQQEVDQCLRAYGQRPVNWLLEHHDVNSNWCLVHATHMDEEETENLAKTGAVVALCPSTEANLGDGLFPLRDFLRHGGRIAIGSDSHVSINPFEELRWLEYGQRLASKRRNIAALRGGHVGSELFLRALEGGAAAGGMGRGGLYVGAAADFVVLSDDDPMLAGHTDDSRLDALVFSGYPLPIESVMVAGRWQVVDGQHVDQDSVRDAYRGALGKLGSLS